MSYVSWYTSTGTVHAVEPGNMTFAVCGEPLESLDQPDADAVTWTAADAPAPLCAVCQAKIA